MWQTCIVVTFILSFIVEVMSERAADATGILREQARPIRAGWAEAARALAANGGEVSVMDHFDDNLDAELDW